MSWSPSSSAFSPCRTSWWTASDVSAGLSRLTCLAAPFETTFWLTPRISRRYILTRIWTETSAINTTPSFYNTYKITHWHCSTFSYCGIKIYGRYNYYLIIFNFYYLQFYFYRRKLKITFRKLIFFKRKFNIFYIKTFNYYTFLS